jgi:exopolysaccharide biosynthesis polyprenyl glycosylphosphotransferase
LLYHNVQAMAHSLRFIDAGVAVLASTILVWYGLEGGAAMREHHRFAITVFGVANLIAFLVIAERMRIYFARRTEDIARELFAVSEVGLYAGCISAVATEIWGGGLPAYSYLQALGAALFALPAVRLAIRHTIRRLRRHGDDYRVWLIVGHNERSASLAETIRANPHFGIRIAEIVDIDDGSRKDSAERRQFESNPPAGVKLRVVRSAEEIREAVAAPLIDERVIDEVVVTLPMRSHYDTVSRILEICCEAGISVRIRPQAFDVLGYDTEVTHVGKIPMLTHYNGPSNYWQLFIKRVIDVLGSAVGLILLSPLLIAVAIAIKLTSPGPVLFRQVRVGLHGRHFQLIKFRSMVKNALQIRDQLDEKNERDGKAFKIRNDARITPLGQWLRKYRIDELPQLWNVVVGDMSLVGPRPFPVTEAVGFEWWHRRRHSMPPGLTCLWQIEDNPRMPLAQWMELDMAYIDRWSIWLDLKVIARTFATVIRGNGW